LLIKNIYIFHILRLYVFFGKIEEMSSDSKLAELKERVQETLREVEAEHQMTHRGCCDRKYEYSPAMGTSHRDFSDYPHPDPSQDGHVPFENSHVSGRKSEEAVPAVGLMSQFTLHAIDYDMLEMIHDEIDKIKQEYKRNNTITFDVDVIADERRRRLSNIIHCVYGIRFAPEMFGSVSPIDVLLTAFSYAQYLIQRTREDSEHEERSEDEIQSTIVCDILKDWAEQCVESHAAHCDVKSGMAEVLCPLPELPFSMEVYRTVMEDGCHYSLDNYMSICASMDPCVLEALLIASHAKEPFEGLGDVKEHQRAAFERMFSKKADVAQLLEQIRHSGRFESDESIRSMEP